LYNNESLGYTAESYKMKEVVEVVSDSTIEFKGKTVNISQDQKANVEQSADYKYGTKDISKVKTGDSGKIVPGDCNCKKLDYSLNIVFDGEKKDVKIDIDGMKKEGLITESEVEAYFSKDVNTEIGISDIQNILGSFESISDLKSAVKSVNGTFSEKVADYDKEADSIKDEVGGNGGNDNTMLIIVIVVVVILVILIGILIWYFRFRY